MPPTGRAAAARNKLVVGGKRRRPPSRLAALSVYFFYAGIAAVLVDSWIKAGRILPAPARAGARPHSAGPMPLPTTALVDESSTIEGLAPSKAEAMIRTNSSDPGRLDTIPDVAAAAAAAAVALTSRRVVCIRGPRWGRTFHQISQIATALQIASVGSGNGTTIVGLSPRLSEYYEEFLDPQRDAIVVNYTGPCGSEFSPEDISLSWNDDAIKAEMRRLIPGAVFRAEAEAFLAALPFPAMTVHRQHLEGACVAQAQKLHNIICPNWYVRNEMAASEFVDACNMEYSMIANATLGTSVVLLTDGQVPELDATFPYISNHSLPVQAWMMARSAVHYGNPLSPLDLVVYYWRLDGADMRPHTCYKPPWDGLPVVVEKNSDSAGRNVLCIRGPPWGRTFNQIIQVATALKIASEGVTNGTSVILGLSPMFSTFYDEFLDPRADILLNYVGPCVAVYTPREIFFSRDIKDMRDELRSLIPKAVFRIEAEVFLATFPRPVTTVHRRHLEGACVPQAEKLERIICPNWRVAFGEMGVSEFVAACNLEYSMIANESLGTTVVLLTDGQVPELDATFPYISNHSFPVQVWMMVRSPIHYGNPMSTVDLVVYYWREDGADMRPRTCYKPAVV